MDRDRHVLLSSQKYYIDVLPLCLFFWLLSTSYEVGIALQLARRDVFSPMIFPEKALSLISSIINVTV